MRQASLSELEHDAKKRKTRREEFLERMDGLIPRERLEGRIEPFCPKGERGRQPYPLATTAANESDVTCAHSVLHGDETDMHGDAGHTGIGRRAEKAGRDVAWHVAMKLGRRRPLDKSGAEEAAKKRRKSVVFRRIEGVPTAFPGPHNGDSQRPFRASLYLPR